MAPPTFGQYSVNDVINIKSVSGLPVLGDGVTDDTNNINAILSQYAGCKIIYFPAGTYIVTNTIHVPIGSRIYGDAYASAISALGSAFWNPDAPTTMFQVGNPGDAGVAQIVDMLFTTADVLQGCKLVEVNAAGNNPGDVGLWNCHFRIGGAAGTKVQTNCAGTPDQCKADWGLIHLSNTSSAYIENMWGWCADHDLDGGNTQVISSGRGMLVEATKGTWLYGTAMEHHTLYQYNFEYAQNVVTAMQQSETPYWQGAGGPDLAPNPWQNDLIPSDPNFSNCAAGDAGCRMAFFERIRGSTQLFLYGGCVWTFFNGNVPCNGDCQQNAIRLLTSSNVYLFGTNVKAVTNMILENTVIAASEFNNQGGWGGVIGAYLHTTAPTGPNPTPGGGPFVTGAGVNWYDPTFSDGNNGYQDPQYYWCFRGPATNFPPIQNWMNFNTMFNLNQQTSMVYEESGPIQGDIYNAIVQVSKASLVDARLILAVIMQEV
jgi:glucan 1,3-beta-glucosidase